MISGPCSKCGGAVVHRTDESGRLCSEGPESYEELEKSRDFWKGRYQALAGAIGGVICLAREIRGSVEQYEEEELG